MSITQERKAEFIKEFGKNDRILVGRRSGCLFVRAHPIGLKSKSHKRILDRAVGFYNGWPAFSLFDYIKAAMDAYKS
ncbi:MAG: hypothetical protein CM15mP46_4830 [Alphaproteobacteria bacterium]|nr:MAG: hypothetical protein CM15mP46_4830 [Alphaproteobacteria bacterium]